jgi:hypothetical protein
VLGRGGSVGTEGSGANVGLARDGIVGNVDAGGGAAGVSNRWRAARLTWVLRVTMLRPKTQGNRNDEKMPWLESSGRFEKLFHF